MFPCRACRSRHLPCACGRADHPHPRSPETGHNAALSSGARRPALGDVLAAARIHAGERRRGAMEKSQRMSVLKNSMMFLKIMIL